MNAMKKKVEEKRKRIKYSLNWTTPKIEKNRKSSDLQEVCSSIFPYTENCSSQWRLILENKDVSRKCGAANGAANSRCITIYLDLVSAELQPVHASYKFAILDKTEKPVMTKTSEGFFSSYSKETGIPKVGNNKTLSFTTSGHMHYFSSKGTLSILCEVAVQSSEMFAERKLDERLSYLRNTVAADIERLYKERNCCDVTLVVKGEEFSAHMAILACRSSVFEAMFSTNIKEANEHKVVIDDIDADVFKYVLDYIYTENVDVEPAMMCELMYAAEKYGLTSLSRYCQKSLASNLTISNAVETLLIADKYGATSLEKTVMNYIANYPEQVNNTEEWKEMVYKRPDLAIKCFEAVFASMKSSNKEACS